MVKTDIPSHMIAVVRELMSRNLDVIEISRRAHIDPITVQLAIDLINGIIT